jgi:hypothetical protein
MEAGRCTATTKAGKPCSAQARPGKRVCLWHDAEAAEERCQNAAKGGQARSSLSRLKRSLPLEERLRELETRAGLREPA